MNTNEGIWLSISDYSRIKGISVSTIRRKIKSNLLSVKEDHGKYFIHIPIEEKDKIASIDEDIKLILEIEYLKKKVRVLEEENSELKMLINIYENGGHDS